MGDVAIRVENLSKQYRIGGPQARYKTLRESLVGAIRSPIRRAGRLLHGEAATDHQETIWALKDVSFEVKHGEVLGIIGRNGAGKSTLLKILSRITAPTEGTVDLYGRVGSLLEVGTGFHPELTGRENIYLNGAILGMKRAEIDRKFDEIVAFAELEKFLDTPVKHYSSGMYVRLAFAVAAHLDPEILLVDEVLAVGDAAFQKKCLGKMGQMSQQGRTVLMVSHRLPAINELCSRCILLENGEMKMNDSPAATIESYTRSGTHLSGKTSISLASHRAYRGLEEFRFVSAELRDENNLICSQMRYASPFTLTIHSQAKSDLTDLAIGFSVFRADGQKLFMSVQLDSGLPSKIAVGTLRLRCQISPNLMMPGRYWINLGAQGPKVSMHVPQALTFDITPVTTGGNGMVESYRQGLFRQPVTWDLVEMSRAAVLDQAKVHG